MSLSFQIKKVLDRKDAYSVLLAFAVSTILTMPLYSIPSDLASRVLPIKLDQGMGMYSTGPTSGPIREVYWRPLLTLAIGLVIVELLLQVFALVKLPFAKKKKK